ncbi:CDP-diacylglycerol--glycerol-3-phosphate 3-phosphatidyltransferase [Priestia taiwanensis]|uniref:CDP-diacylglycerol--glycerol-3-phosphate 3-phosphatidyltransferase n=1 Tax=Priestia taiwanensis TaxID=1347902 RepID=A0A917AP40_9BACI|nr:CDP-diacylglycerol--glycerol-3-phosphate 3-phosphatidyltransferase [Priestia taiwanensis]MBM7362773.1 CDP-diacylglycerol--glycerol-3-phosphate 3-phosphatidyltransferase [Priestia taiwanensis]GGE64983.1 CDP-diacylglycerol--glycerol-3-phosphate 3-phosphatidyltransferase [Priestia taiwanensis]
MNIPNKITLSRILLIPLFLIVMLAPIDWGIVTIGDEMIPYTHLVGVVLFSVAALTDWIDGYYARKHNLITNLGKFLDPLADKLLVSSALIVLVDLGYVQTWMVIVIISREFAVTGLRLILAGKGEVVAANMLGKLKTWMQLTAIILYLLHNVPFNYINVPMDEISMWIAVILTIVSGWDYFNKNKEVLSQR